MNGFIGVIKRSSAHLSFFALFGLVFLIGVSGGAFFAAAAQEGTLSEFAANLTYSAEHSAENLSGIVANSAVSAFVLMITLWLSGFFSKVPCFVLMATVTAFKGAATGYTIGMLICLYSAKGLALAVAGVLPQYVVLLPTMFVSSAVLLNNFAGTPLKRTLKGRGILLVLMLSAGGISAFVDAVVCGRIIKLLF